MPKKKFDLIVIGSGSAGFSAAEAANQHGASVCIIEEDAWGGECPNYACVPTKALLRSAKIYHFAKKEAAQFGVHARGVTFNFSEIMKRKRNVVDVITGEGERLKKTAKKLGIATRTGSASFVDERTVQVGGETLQAKKFVIATGAVDFIPPINGIEDSGYITYEKAVGLRSLPDSIAIVGGGPVGCEFATFFQMLGSKVTLLQLSPSVLHREDADISTIAQKSIEHIGVNVHVNTQATKVEKVGNKLRVTYRVEDGKAKSIEVATLLLAAGKRANVEHLNLEQAGVKLDEKGRLIVSEKLQTSQKHIFAAGDVSGGMLFTHTAHEEGYIAGVNAMQKTARTMLKRDMRVVPRVTFTAPEVASVGMTEQEAEKSGKDVSIGKFPVGALGRSVTEGERTGLVKIVVDKKTRKILGGHIIADRAGEMIHEIALAMQANLTIDAVAGMIHAFPTYSEAISAAAADA